MYTAPGETYNADDDGFVFLIQVGDVDRDLDETWDGWPIASIAHHAVIWRIIKQAQQTPTKGRLMDGANNMEDNA